MHTDVHSGLSEDARCLICDADVVQDGYNILYSVVGNSGSVLLNNIYKILRRDLDAVLARSSILCKRYVSSFAIINACLLKILRFHFACRCYNLFGELEAAENKCGIIKNEIRVIYMKTCELYNDVYLSSVPGVACQTEDIDLEFEHVSEKQSDLKLKIALVPTKRRGRPIKSQQRRCSSSGDNIQVDFNPPF